MSVFAKSAVGNELILKTGNFWPDIEVGLFRKKGRVPTIVEDQAVYHLLERAFITFLDDIGDYELEQREKGIDRLSDVPSPMIGSRNRQEILFESAIFAYAKKLISDNYQDIDIARKPGQDKTKELEKSSRLWSAEYLKSVRQFLGEEASFVGLT